MHDTQFRQLLDHFGYSWSGYRRVRKGVKKRLSRHMQKIGCRDMDAYITAIKSYDDVHLDFERRMTVSTSRFFRDRGLWEILQARILPLLAQTSSQTIKIWFAGCASGEEVYSFKIIWEELRPSLSPIQEIHLLATDMHPEYLYRAQTAVYPNSSMREVPVAFRNRYFEKFGRGRYQLRPGIQEGIVWHIHDILSDPPKTAFDLIFLRNNLLTYYTDPVKTPVFTKLVDRLAPGGFLIIGSHEKIPVEAGNLIPFEESSIIFHNKIPILHPSRYKLKNR